MLNNLDFSSFNDSTLDEYHFDFYFFSIKKVNINLLINYIKNNKNKYDFIYNMHKIFNNAMPYLKIGYLNNNNNCDIHIHNNRLYEYLLSNNILPIISINKLFNIKISNNYNSLNELPKNFDINIYREYNDDLKNFDDNFLYNHFIEYGQYEYRKYMKDNDISVYPKYIIDKLVLIDLLKFF